MSEIIRPAFLEYIVTPNSVFVLFLYAGRSDKLLLSESPISPLLFTACILNKSSQEQFTENYLNSSPIPSGQILQINPKLQ